MTKFDWEKANRKETERPPAPTAEEMAKHARRRMNQRQHLARKTKRLNEIEQAQKAPYARGIEEGKRQEQERILSLLAKVSYGLGDGIYGYIDLGELQALIKGEQK